MRWQPTLNTRIYSLKYSLKELKTQCQGWAVVVANKQQSEMKETGTRHVVLHTLREARKIDGLSKLSVCGLQ
jgi:hypothetical protein